MDSVNYKNKNVGEREWQYNWQHVVFVTNKSRKNFKKEYNRNVARFAIEEAARAYSIGIKEFSFGDDYAHVHMEISVPNTLSMSQVVQILKSHSASVIFQKIPNFMKLYPRGSFWCGQYSNHSVEPTDESTIKNYIRRQDVSNVDNQRRLFN
ncbi:MAG: IS200/IS605 family transposase [Candidatus Marsarchaeota archaeon]|nr:IS200/IS605 family transposase [Candidatus Marsarchaeota archaeon]